MDEKGASYISSGVRFTKQLKTVSKFVVIITKCTGGISDNLCEYYIRWVWTTGLCSFIPAKDMFWTPFIDSFEPPFRCPVKGYYFMRNATLDLDKLKNLVPDLSKHIWPVEIQLYNENGDLVICVAATGEFRYVRGTTTG
ncbi:uncharacterized protein LOC117648327 [Thrips palmi]|uniref:Uncharacterized protein LOC117648327 n=1 Tax=Thrips palmi TaxID=161013 RepID=A0A6P8ZCS2_THRPL|nr:uncharacterized protein LOC117648327 [Thrips palmi]